MDDFPFRPVGVEVEFGIKGLIADSPREVPDELYFLPLEMISRRFRADGHSVSSPTIATYERPGVSNGKKAVWIDPLGREWQVVPEGVNTPISSWPPLVVIPDYETFDGVELVTPPLSDEHQLQMVGDLVDEMLSTQYELGMGGTRSSIHSTFHLKDFIKSDKADDERKLVDTFIAVVCFMEAYMPAILAWFSPSRSGGLVSRQHVPVSIDHPELMRQLTDAYGQGLTVDQLENLIDQHSDHEISIIGNRFRAWKTRALNFKKFFGLLNEERQFLLENRMPDIIDGRQVVEDVQFLQRAMAIGVNCDPRELEFPLAGIEIDRQFLAAGLDTVHSEVLRLGVEQYQAFMTRLGIASPPEPFTRFFRPSKIEILTHLNDPSMSMVSLMRDYLGTYRDHPMTREEEKLLNAHIRARSLSRTLKYLRTASQHERLVAAYATEAWRYYLMRIFRSRQGRLLKAQAIRATQAEWQRNVRHHSRRCSALHDRFQLRRARMIKNAMRRSDRGAQ